MEIINDTMTQTSEQEGKALSRQAGEALDATRYEDAAALYARVLELDKTRVNDWINQVNSTLNTYLDA